MIDGNYIPATRMVFVGVTHRRTKVSRKKMQIVKIFSFILIKESNSSKNLIQEAPRQNDCRSPSAMNELQEFDICIGMCIIVRGTLHEFKILFEFNILLFSHCFVTMFKHGLNFVMVPCKCYRRFIINNICYKPI